jgi:hypothetical protein
MNTPDVIATPAAKPAANEPDIGAAVVALSKTKEALRAPADMVDSKGRRIKPFGSVFHPMTARATEQASVPLARFFAA